MSSKVSFIAELSRFVDIDLCDGTPLYVWRNYIYCVQKLQKRFWSILLIGYVKIA